MSWDHIEAARRAAFEAAAARHRPGYRWLNARGTHWLQPATEDEYRRHLGAGSPRSLRCEQCDGLFIGHFSPRRRFCSEVCSRLSIAQRRETRQLQGDAVCPECGRIFSVTRSRRRYCSATCRTGAPRK